MTVGIARAIQWVVVVLVASMLVLVFLAHAHGRAAAELILFIVILLVVGAAVGIITKAEGVIHLRKKQSAQWDSETATRFPSGGRSPRR